MSEDRITGSLLRMLTSMQCRELLHSSPVKFSPSDRTWNLVETTVEKNNKIDYDWVIYLDGKRTVRDPRREQTPMYTMMFVCPC